MTFLEKPGHLPLVKEVLDFVSILLDLNKGMDLVKCSKQIISFTFNPSKWIGDTQ
jgi:hypothetical protein